MFNEYMSALATLTDMKDMAPLLIAASSAGRLANAPAPVAVTRRGELNDSSPIVVAIETKQVKCNPMNYV